MMDVTTRTTCRACGHGPLEDLFSLGEQVVSDFPETPVTEPRVPIDLVRCPACTLVQQRYTVPSDLLYRRHYWYRSGTTDTMRRALKDVVDAATARVQLDPGDVVLDIGSNDGTLLRCYSDNVFKVGYEPAENLYWDGTKGINLASGKVVKEFWSADSFKDCGFKPPRIVTACGMLYDLEDPTAFVRDVARVLAPDGLFVAQLQCLRQTVRLRDAGNLCHEHLEFYTLASLVRLLASVGLVVGDVEENDVNGGSYRLYCRRPKPGPWTDHLDDGRDRVEDALNHERDEGLLDPATLRAFGDSLIANAMELRTLVERLVKAGKSVWVYGASTKGNVVLQSAGVDHRLVKYAADRSPEKVGRYCAGSGILVRSEEDFRRERPDFAIVMPYSFLEEMTAREADWRAAGGRFIVPIPEVRVIRWTRCTGGY